MSKTSEQMRQLRREANTTMELVRRSALAQGMYSAGKVIHDLLTDESLPVDDRMANAIGFCRTCMNINEPKPEKDGDDNAGA